MSFGNSMVPSLRSNTNFERLKSLVAHKRHLPTFLSWDKIRLYSESENFAPTNACNRGRMLLQWRLEQTFSKHSWQILESSSKIAPSRRCLHHAALPYGPVFLVQNWFSTSAPFTTFTQNTFCTKLHSTSSVGPSGQHHTIGAPQAFRLLRGTRPTTGPTIPRAPGYARWWWLPAYQVAIMAIVREFTDNTHLDALVIAKVKPLRRWCGATILELLQIRIGCGSCCHPITHAKLYSFQIFNCQFIFLWWDIPTHWLQRGTPRQYGDRLPFCSSSRISATKKKALKIFQKRFQSLPSPSMKTSV